MADVESVKWFYDFARPFLKIGLIIMKTFIRSRFIKNMQKDIEIEKNGKLSVELGNDRLPLKFEIFIRNNSLLSIEIERIILIPRLEMNSFPLGERIDVLKDDKNLRIKSPMIKIGERKAITLLSAPHPLALKHHKKWRLEGKIYFSSAGVDIIKDVSIDCGKIEETMFKQAREKMKNTLKEYLNSLNSDN